MISEVIFRTLIMILVLHLGLDKYCNGARRRDSDADGQKQIKGIVANFSARYFAELFQGIGSKSVVTSPLASLISLAPLAIYSEGNTNQEITKALAMDPITIKRVLPIIIKMINKDQNGAKLEMSVSMFFNANLKVSKKFNKTAKRITGSRPRSLEFREVERAAAIINGWVSNKTHNSIKYVMKPDMFSKKAYMIVVNTLYFKNPWGTALRTRENDETFYSSNEEKSMQFMDEVGKFEYTKLSDIDSQILVKRYENPKFATTIILPQSRTGLPDLVKHLNQGDLLQDILRMRFISHPVEVILPVISLENSIDVIPLTNEMGIKKAYTDTAEFKNVLRYSSNSTVKVSQIIQGIKFVMNENGTEGTTQSNKPVASDFKEVFLFRADHPFIFVVAREDLVLYMGAFNP